MLLSDSRLIFSWGLSKWRFRPPHVYCAPYIHIRRFVFRKLYVCLGWLFCAKMSRFECSGHLWAIRVSSVCFWRGKNNEILSGSEEVPSLKLSDSKLNETVFFILFCILNIIFETIMSIYSKYRQSMTHGSPSDPFNNSKVSTLVPQIKIVNG